MQFFVTGSDELPIYRQLMRQIVEAIAARHLKPGDKLPSHRDLAEQLVIAPLTVKKAYDELESQGYIETQRGRGTFVQAKLPKGDRSHRREQLKALARKLLSDAYLAGFDLTATVKLLEDADRELMTGVGQGASGASVCTHG